MTTARPPDRNPTFMLIDYNTIPKSVEQFRGAVNDRSDRTELYQGIFISDRRATQTTSNETIPREHFVPSTKKTTQTELLDMTD
jgi:hypothetical protein